MREQMPYSALSRRVPPEVTRDPFFSQMHVKGRHVKLVSAVVRTVMRGAITLTDERIYSGNYDAPTNFCPSANLRNSRRWIYVRGGLSESAGRGGGEGSRCETDQRAAEGSRDTVDHFAGSRVFSLAGGPRHLACWVYSIEYTWIPPEIHRQRFQTCIQGVGKKDVR